MRKKQLQDIEFVREALQVFHDMCFKVRYDEKLGEEIEINIRPMTLERLACCLGVTRQTIHNYTRSEHISELEAEADDLSIRIEEAGKDEKKFLKARLKEIENELDIIDLLFSAKAEIQAYTAERLFDRDGFNGAKFSLMNNYPDDKYADKQTVEADVNSRVVVIDDVG